MSAQEAEIDAIKAAHQSRVQNIDGDWLCTCGAFLCAPGDARLAASHRQHVETILARRATKASEGLTCGCVAGPHGGYTCEGCS